MENKIKFASKHDNELVTGGGVYRFNNKYYFTEENVLLDIFQHEKIGFRDFLIELDVNENVSNRMRDLFKAFCTNPSDLAKVIYSYFVANFYKANNTRNHNYIEVKTGNTTSALYLDVLKNALSLQDLEEVNRWLDDKFVNGINTDVSIRTLVNIFLDTYFDTVFQDVDFTSWKN